MTNEFSLSKLKDIDEETKGGAFDHDVASLLQFYDDNSRNLTISHLEQMQLGLKGNRFPIEVNLLRRIIERVSVIYQNPPTRRLKQSGVLLSEDSIEHKNMLDLLDKAQYNLAMRRGDRLSALLGQHVKRFYPSPAENGVVLRIFTPNDVIRAPNPVAPDQIEMDSHFALRLAGGMWEYWEKTSDGWRMLMLTDKGEALPDENQPMAIFSGDKNSNPDFLLKSGSELPVQLCFDEWPGGRPWVTPKRSRISWVKTINAQMNDLWALIMHQAHQSKVYKKRDPNHRFPEQSGPQKVLEIDAEDDYQEFTPSPMVREVMETIEEEIRMWLLSEDLPVSEFDKSKQVVTGATLKVQERPLINRQEAQIPMAEANERKAWRKFRSLHNAHADEWGAAILSENTEMQATIAPLHIPVDQREQGEVLMAQMAAGWISEIDAIQRVHNLPRDKAIEHYHRVVEDNGMFPLPSVGGQEEPEEEPDSMLSGLGAVDSVATSSLQFMTDMS